ncbi:MarR family transcriptional regulator [Janthinobacterium sp. SUN118]|uniref:MarR family transcriptional regulator n=1 Tax=Janthinobacterium sp. SUN118 TaxID=3004100 RepID=UPI0025B0463B|nr:MarR family transcriptional regulator [Janthinobacterium sp. SUN118]MDN2709079.1 MarR family transcriptional regulator [Janthinobacterium sp. SUN118]
MKSSLGTQLRHLIELLDGAVGAAYDEAGLRYRPRYTPVMRVLMAQDAASIGAIAAAAGITQPAATQTVALMIKEGLVSATASDQDGRQKLIQLTEQGRAMLPAIQRCWQATAGAAASLDADLPYPLSKVLQQAVAALESKPFGARIRDAAVRAEDGIESRKTR